ncbi:MAG: proline--tRNA ligase [Deltaproteobacteria bacterium]|nr:proline--tRNA ligase [Deltaproteobacteria bacterium]
MRLSRYHHFTYREVPNDAVVASHRLMIRAGFIKKVAAGIYTYMPMGLRTIRKVEAIVREEMNRAGAVELLMPAVCPAELWQESKRWQFYGPELLRLKDRKGADFCVGPTHEEVVTDTVRQDVRSYRQLPFHLYQIQTKFRDEARPRFGLMRGREFIMKDGYSFHADDEDAKREYWVMYETYRRIFGRCGLKFKAVFAATGNIGGTLSHEFQVLADSGEDAILSCSKCDYAANVEKAACLPPAGSPSEAPRGLQKVATPGKRTVEEVTAFLGVPAAQLVKTLVYVADGTPGAALVRGDHELNEAKLKSLLGCNELSIADDETVTKATGAPVGFAGPVGLKLKLVADETIKAMANFVTGANAADAHYVNTNAGRDFNVETSGDIRTAIPGDRCAKEGCAGVYEAHRGIEVGQVFFLGTKYSHEMHAIYLDEHGKEHPIVMGCYGIGIGRTAAAAIEQNHDADGIVWPMPIAPFQAALLRLGAEVKDEAERVYRDLLDAGVEVLFDDREERPGVMFKDADLVGIPVRVSVGKKSLEKGGAELKLRRDKTVQIVPIAEVGAHVKAIVNQELARCRPDQPE